MRHKKLLSFSYKAVDPTGHIKTMLVEKMWHTVVKGVRPKMAWQGPPSLSKLSAKNPYPFLKEEIEHSQLFIQPLRTLMV
jgi:hypothetical protein